MRYTEPTLLEHLASNYVLGTLQGGARRRFDRLQADRIDIRMRVAAWEMRLGQLAQSIPPQQVSSRLWPAIAARTEPHAARNASPAAQNSPRGVYPNLSRPPLPSSASPGIWGWLKPAGFTLGGLSAGLLAASALFFTVPTLFVTSDQIAMRTGEKLPQSYVGLLTDGQGNGKLLVSSLRQGRTMTIKVIGPITATSTAPIGSRLVMWAVPADPAKNGPAFVLGNVPATGSVVSQLPDTSEKLLSKVSKLIVTVETLPNPITPSDILVYSGNCAKLW